MSELEGRHVVVTGGRGALGSAVVAASEARGAICHVPSLETGIDLTEESSVVAYYRALPALWASIHCCGGFAMAPIGETTAARFRAQLELNAMSCFLSCREAVERMRQGGQGGRIVNVIARPVLEPVGGMIAYSASKAAVASITQSLACEVAGEGILVNAVAPSIIDTSANRAAMPDADFTKWPSPAALATAMLALASPLDTCTTGTLVPVYGGLA